MAKTIKRKSVIRIFGIIIILLPLLFFKYFNAINESLYTFFALSGVRLSMPQISLLLPVGISFYTFAAIGYVIDVYNEEIRTENNILYVGLFVSFFPLLLSGPIERGKNILPQLKNLQPFNYGNAVSGLKMMLWGYFMKLVVADRIAIYVDAIFNNLLNHSGITITLAALLYPIQMYADFGGYSLIAIGCAKMLGINVVQNFKRPFFAISMSEFWRRWHISLIKWLTDYIYTPLSFYLRKYKIYGIIISLLITFIISGLWHGASLNFLFWGLIQGILLSFEAATNQKRAVLEKKLNLKTNKFYIVICIITTYLLFSLSQIFGRSADINDAITVFNRIFTIQGSLFIDEATIGYSLLGVVILLSKDFIDEFFPQKFSLMNSKNIIIRYSTYLALTALILLIGVFDGGQFIYFQF